MSCWVRFYVQGTGPRRCGFLRRESWIQADGVVLRAGGRVVPARQVRLSRSEERARCSLLFFLCCPSYSYKNDTQG